MDEKKTKDPFQLMKFFSWSKLVICIVLVVVLVNKYGVSLIFWWQLGYNSIVIDYLRVILGAPSVVLILFVVFFQKFSSAIDYFIRNMRINYKGVEATSQQAKDASPDGTQVSDKDEKEIVRLSKQDAQSVVDSIEKLDGENKANKQQIDDLVSLVRSLASRSELFEFKYLNEVLVLNTKLALRDLHRSGSVTGGVFIQSINVLSSVPNKYFEQLAIHNALLVNGLIEEKGSLVNVSEKGERYLRFNGFIK